MLAFFYRIGGPNPTLAVDANSYFPLGLAHVHVWNRKFEAADKHTRNYKYQPLEQKESFRWVDSARKSRVTLQQAEHITFIADREADMYALWQETDQQVDWLLRARDDRCLYQREEKLFELLSTSAVKGEIQLAIQHHEQHADRLAELEVRYCRVKLARPKREKFSQIAYQQVYAVEVKEKASSVPTGEQPIHWRLLTTHQINTLSDALQVIEWYSLRWQIEQLFRTLKQQGLQIHRSQLSTGKALKKLTLMALPVALSCMQLVEDRTGRVGEKASIIFKPRLALCML